MKFGDLVRVFEVDSEDFVLDFKGVYVCEAHDKILVARTKKEESLLKFSRAKLGTTCYWYDKSSVTPIASLKPIPEIKKPLNGKVMLFVKRDSEGDALSFEGISDSYSEVQIHIDSTDINKADVIDALNKGDTKLAQDFIQCLNGDKDYHVSGEAKDLVGTYGKFSFHISVVEITVE